MTRHSLRVESLAVLLLSATAIPSGAQGVRPDSATRLPDIVRTVAREPGGYWGFPGAFSSSLIGPAASASGRLDQALTLAPGVMAQSRTGGVDLRIVIRGFGARGAGDRSNAGTLRGIRVLIDGFPETEPDGRTSLDLFDIGAGTRLDVLRSNASATWGNAAGGVIALSTVPWSLNSSGELMVSVGGFGLKRATTQLGSDLGGGILYASATRTSQDGWRQNSGGDRTLLNLGFATPADRVTSVGIHVLGSLNNFSIPGPLTPDQFAAEPQSANATYLSRLERRENRMARIGATVTHHFSGNLALIGSAFVTPKHLERSERGTYRFFDRVHRGGSLLLEREMGNAGAITVGGDLAMQGGPAKFWSLTADGEQGTTLQQDKDEGSRNLGVFAQHSITFGENFTLATGVRYDAINYDYQDFITPKLSAKKTFSRVTPKLGLTWRVGPTHAFYAALGGGVEAPAGNETDPPGTFGQDTVTAINPLLDPIRSTTFEVGTRQLITSKASSLRSFSYDVSLYQTEVRDEIVPYRGGRFYFTAGAARRRGLEASARFDLPGRFALAGSLTLQDHKYTDYVVDSVHYSRPGHFADYSGNRVVGTPRSFYGAELSYDVQQVRLSAGVQSIGEYFADDANSITVPRSTFASVTLSLPRAVNIGGGLGVRGLITVNNLFNRTNVASAFLNPDLVGGKPAVFEPGLPRHAVVGVTVEWLGRRGAMR